MDSGSPTPTPYLGSRISLISRSEIRYEGILYSVDTKESTIALAQVKSFGTEDRDAAVSIPVRNEIFEFIIFKASDIKDLMVCETPKPTPPQLPGGLPYDPAIVQVSQAPAQPENQFATPSFPPEIKPMMPTAPISRPQYQQQPASGHSSPSASPEPPRNRPEHSAPGHRGGQPQQYDRQNEGRRYDQRENHQQQRDRHVYHNQNRDRNEQPSHRGGAQPVYTGMRTYSQVAGRPEPPRQQQHQEAYAQPHRGGMRGGRGGYNHSQVAPPTQQQRGGGHFENRSYGGPRGGGNFHHEGQNHRGAGGNRGGGAPRGRPPHGQPLKFDGDYDFEGANAKFQETLDQVREMMAKADLGDSTTAENGGKDESNGAAGHPHDVKMATEQEVIAQQMEALKQAGQEPKYDKTKSFFDSISCEAAERAEGQNSSKPNWRKEREINQETFGQTSVRRYGYGGGFRRYGQMPFRGQWKRGGYNQPRGGYNNTANNRTYSR